MSTEEPAIIEINDPVLDGEAIARHVRQQVAQRRAQGAYGPDPTIAGPEPLRPVEPAPRADIVGVGFPGLRESLAELIAAGHLRERDFVSDTPFVGSLIVRVRRFWNWMSTKWYVRPILSQQSAVNARTARVLSDLAQWHELDAQRLRQLEERVAELEGRLTDLQSQREP
jgi:hypothetical protein